MDTVPDLAPPRRPSTIQSEHRVPRSRQSEIARRTRQAADEIEALLP